MIAEWITRAAARQGSAPYLEAPYFEAPYLEAPYLEAPSLEAPSLEAPSLAAPSLAAPSLAAPSLAAPSLADGAGTGTLTYAGLRRSTRAWADCLDRAGIPPGARVAVRLLDPLGYATALVSILGAGRVVVPLDPGAPAADLSRVLAAAQPQAAVSDSGDGLPPGLPVLQPPDRSSGPNESFGPNEPGPSPAAERAVIPAGASRGSGSGGIYLCTSGTTGAPKGILLREDQLCHVAASVAGHHRLFPADRGYCCLPLFHVNAEVVGLLATLAAGACLVLDRKFSRRGFWELIEQRRITWVNAVPAIIAVLAMAPPAAPAAGRVRFVRSASAPLPPSVLRRFEEAYGIPVIETYGMTEAASMIAANPLDGPRKAGSVGRPAGTQVRIARLAAGRYVPAPALEVGRVQIRGRGVITEYAQNGPPGAIDPDGWLDTGDLGHLDQDGYLFLAGRSDDVINRGGEKIYPREIEDVLLAQPGVRSAAVVSAHDDVLGERPVAYVVPAGPWPGELADALRAACEAALPRPKRPTAFCLVPELPLGPTGKVARRRLQELGRPELGLQELGLQELPAAHHALPSAALGGGGHRLSGGFLNPAGAPICRCRPARARVRRYRPARAPVCRCRPARARVRRYRPARVRVRRCRPARAPVCRCRPARSHPWTRDCSPSRPPSEMVTSSLNLFRGA